MPVAAACRLSSTLPPLLISATTQPGAVPAAQTAAEETPCLQVSRPHLPSPVSRQRLVPSPRVTPCSPHPSVVPVPPPSWGKSLSEWTLTPLSAPLCPPVALCGSGGWWLPAEPAPRLVSALLPHGPALSTGLSRWQLKTRKCPLLSPGCPATPAAAPSFKCDPWKGLSRSRCTPTSPSPQPAQQVFQSPTLGFLGDNDSL